jgi:uncharacterized protein YcnI
MNRTIARPLAALLTVALVGIAGPASAHVGVSSTDATQGGFGKAVFRVPTESETASTTRLIVTLPKDTPFALISAQSKPGWKVTVKEDKLDQPTKVGDFELTKAAHTVTWTATGDGIPPSQFDEFAISGGPFPKAGKMAFTVDQAYSDGTVVSWNQVQKGDNEPERPAPTLTLTRPAEDSDGAAIVSEDGGNDTGLWLGGAALVMAAVALVVALRENRRRA